jgi:hypothetical protein
MNWELPLRSRRIASTWVANALNSRALAAAMIATWRVPHVSRSEKRFGERYRLRAEIAKTLAEAEKLKAETRSAEETWRKLWRRPGHDVDRTCC